MKKVCFLDFEDSFSYNVIQELTELNLDVQVTHWMDLEVLPDADLLVLGPGPGHPDDYQRIFPLIKEWLTLKRALLGVCLGHQIFWRLQGEEVVRSKDPLHGQKIKLQLGPKWQQWLKLPAEVWVQRYNSLCVPGPGAHPDLENLNFNDEIMITRGEKVITYQFHPESMGTTFRKAFFIPVLSDLV